MENTNEKTAGQKLQEELTWKFRFRCPRSSGTCQRSL